MAPFLEAGTVFSEEEEVKYVTVDGRIYYSDATDPMDKSLEQHAKLADKAGAYTPPFGKPTVDDGGILHYSNGEIKLRSYTTTCQIRDQKLAIEITTSVIKKTLGEKIKVI